MKTPHMGTWYKSTRSDGGRACVEVRHDPYTTLVRDTKDNGHGPILEFSAGAWSKFIASRVWEG